MVLLSMHNDYQIRQSNKEPEWSNLCNDIFNEYLDADELFDLGTTDRERSSPNDSVNLFDFSGSSEQSHHTEATSPIPAREVHIQNNALEAKQPRAQEPHNFWRKTLKALEQNAAEYELRQRKLRSVQSHPDFLSLGGLPSPPAVPCPLTEQRLPRSAANGSRRDITSRSLSRGRPTGIVKNTTGIAVHPHATGRKCSASPSKMMTPSRYRAGFRDIWSDRTRSSPKKYELHVPPTTRPLSPMILINHNRREYRHVPRQTYHEHNDEYMLPLTNTFEQTHINTPETSPRFNHAAHAHNSYFSEPQSISSDVWAVPVIPQHDIAPLYPARTSSLAPNKIDSFDFQFQKSTDDFTWDDGNAGTDMSLLQGTNDLFVECVGPVRQSIETNDFDNSVFGASYDPYALSNKTNTIFATIPSTLDDPFISRDTPYYPAVIPHGLPTTSVHYSRSRIGSSTPPPTPHEPRSPRKASSSNRRASRHRRTKSTNSTSGHINAPTSKGGFVNFTAEDSTKILSGVAPSGSSKTKARREKEAEEKRRRLSQVAVKAVVEAGGDVAALGKAGLLI